MNESKGHVAFNHLEHFCIHGSALLAKVLHRAGFPDAFPLTVGVRIFNPAYQQWVETHGPPRDEASAKASDDAGGLTIILGKGAEGLVPKDRWPGHLAVVIPRVFDDHHALIDLTIVQAHRPEWGINLQPVCLRVSDAFINGAKPFNVKVHGALLVYDAFPNDHSYNDDGDWMAIKGLDTACQNVQRRLQER